MENLSLNTKYTWTEGITFKLVHSPLGNQSNKENAFNHAVLWYLFSAAAQL